MKQFLVIACGILLLQNFGMAQFSWKSPGYKAEAYRKVMVLAKFSDELNKRLIEDAMVKLLNEKGIIAIPAYSNIVDSDISSEKAFMIKADALEIDGLIVYTIKGTNTEYKNTPSVNMNLGLPVKLGIFRGFLGTNVPVAGGTKSVTIVNAKASFYNRSSKSMQWSLPLSGKLKKGADKLADSFALLTLNAMLKDQLFLLKQ